MKTFNLLHIIFSLLLIATICISGPAAAMVECDSGKIEEAKAQLPAQIATSIDNAITAVTNYNNAADKYISNCNKNINKGTPSMLNTGMISAAGEINTNYITPLSNPELFKNTGINWNGENPTDETCKKLLNEAKNLAKTQQSTFENAKYYLAIKANEQAFSQNADCMCAENKNEAECTALIEEAEEQEAEKAEECEHFTTYLAEMSVCILCPIFEIILSTNASLATLAWDALSGNLQKVAGIFFAVFLAIESLKQVGNMAGSGISSYLRTVLGLGFKVAITVLMLSNSTYIYNLFISPVIKGGLDMGIALLGVGDPGAQSCIASGSSYSGAGGSTTLDNSISGSILKTIDCFGQSASIIPAVGRGLICHGWHNKGHFIPDFNMWFIGLILYVFGIGIWMVLSFYLIDCTVQLGILCALVPILIACWPFKVTQQYSYKGVKMLMNTFFNFVMMGVVMLFGMKIIAFAAGSPSGNFQEFIRAANANDTNRLKELASLDGLAILVLIACCVFSFKLIGKGSSIADKFAKGSGTGIGAKMGGAAASIATGLAKSAGRLSAKVGVSVGGTVADKTGLTAGVNKAQNAVVGGVLKGASVAGKAVGLGRFQPQKTKKDNENKSGDDSSDEKTNNKNTETESGGNSGGNSNNDSNGNSGGNSNNDSYGNSGGNSNNTNGGKN